jgi:enoyl-CoA hydratase/carnithine racemase
VAAVHGACVGAGVDLIGACDLRVATQDAYFQIAEVDVAITADLGTLQRLGLPRAPRACLRELVYTGRRLVADEAERLGLVNGLAADREAAHGRRAQPGAHHRRQIAAGHCRRQAQPQLQPRPPGRGRACATSPSGTPPPWSAPTSAKPSRRAAPRPSPSFGPLDG